MERLDVVIERIGGSMERLPLRAPKNPAAAGFLLGAVLIDCGGCEAVADCVVGVVFELQVLRECCEFVIGCVFDFLACDFDGVDDGVFRDGYAVYPFEGI